MTTIQFGPGEMIIAGQKIRITGGTAFSFDDGVSEPPPMVREIIFEGTFSNRFTGRRWRKAMCKIYAEWERRRRIESQVCLLLRRFPEGRRC